MENLTGQTISHYKILELIGQGGMAVVYKAEDLKLKRLVALKFLSQDLTRDEEAKKRFIHEGQTSSAIEHYNICNIHEIDESDSGQIFIAMSYYEGQTLKEIIESGKKTQITTPLTIDYAIDIAIQIAQGLAKAHEKGIIHRDIKPANIIITTEEIVKILDFGLAKLKGQTKLTKDGSTMGTVSYMSPEQVRGEEVDHRCDIWSLGVVIYEMVTGRLPFKGDFDQLVLYAILNEDPESISKIRSDIPPGLEQLINKAIAKDLSKRFQRIEQLLSDLFVIKEQIKSAESERRVSSLKVINRIPWTSPKLLIPSAVIIIIVICFWILYPFRAVPFSERDWILIADFENNTGEEIFDQSLNTALTVGIQQSKYVNVFPRSRVKETLSRMQIEKADTLNESLAREVALREGIRALIVPKISRIADVYLMSAVIVDPNSQVSVKTAVEQAKGHDKVLDALDALSNRIRRDLGESLESIAQQNLPLAKATTSSLEALKNYSRSVYMGQLNESSHNLLLKAVDLDSNFALAHADLGASYYWYQKQDKGEYHFNTAMSRLDRLTERERLWIPALIAGWRGNREEALIKYQLYLEQYPDDFNARFKFGYQYLMLDRCEEAIKEFREVLRIKPTDAASYINIATCLSKMYYYTEAIEQYLKAFDLEPDWMTRGNLNHEFGFTYVKMEEFDRAREIFTKMLEKDNWKKARGHRSLALLDMYKGKYSDAIEHLQEAILYQHTAQSWTSEVRDRLYLSAAYKTKAKDSQVDNQIREVIKIYKEQYIAPHWLLKAAKLCFRMQKYDLANQIYNHILKILKEENLDDRIAIHVLHGELELSQNNFDKAIEFFQMANKLKDDIYNLESLAYALFLAGYLDQSIAKYEQLIGKKDLGWEGQEYWIQAHYQLGKIFEQKGESDQARGYYKKFINIWVDGDQDLPDLLDAKLRLENLM